MKWFDSFLNRPITKILRIDAEQDYSLLHPNAFFIMFDETNGLLIGSISDGKSIQIEGSSLPDIYDAYGIEYSEAILNELKPEDKLNNLLNQTIQEIRTSVYGPNQAKGDNFIIKEERYKDVVVEFTRDKVNFHNNFGGHLAFV